MEKQVKIINEARQRKIEDSFVLIQNQVEVKIMNQQLLKSSFNNIDAYLDSLLNVTSDSLSIVSQRSLEPSSCASSINLPQTKKIDNLNFNFASQLYQDIQPLITTKIKNQLQFKEQSLNIIHNQLIEELQKNKNQKCQEQNLQYANQGIQQLSTQVNIKQSQTPQSTDQQNVKPFTYQLIQEYSISQNDYGFAIAINKDCSTLVAGSRSKINVFEFKQGMLKLIQSLSEHNDQVDTLNFMTKQNQFISGSHDRFIIIWKNDQNNQWISQQKLNGHSSYIFCLILNYNEDLIVSGSEDKSIKFWIKKNEWLCEQTITDHSNEVYGLSLNQQQNRLVSCGADSLILIIEQSEQNKQWIVKQKIKVEQYGYRVCFIDNNIFIFSLFSKEQMSVFEMKNEFTKIKDIPVKCGSDWCCLFPQQYINTKCILVSKNGEYVNLIRKQQNGDLLTQQSIHFGTRCLYGVMSDDGQYLITWDDKSKQIQIRRYQVQ